MGSTGSGSYGPACSFNPLATAGALTTTTGSAVYSQGGINLGVQDLPITAKTCGYPAVGGTCAGIAQNNSLIQAAAKESALVQYAALGLLAVAAYLIYKHFK